MEVNMPGACRPPWCVYSRDGNEMKSVIRHTSKAMHCKYMKWASWGEAKKWRSSTRHTISPALIIPHTKVDWIYSSSCSRRKEGRPTMLAASKSLYGGKMGP